jgi:hypothetical protein
MKTAIVLLACAFAAHAAAIDGRWTAQASLHRKKAANKQVTFTLDLATQNGTLSGTVLASSAKKPRPQPIENGRVDGDRVTFSTHASKKADSPTFLWTAALNGDQLTGTRMRQGAKKGQSFTAKRMN